MNKMEERFTESLFLKRVLYLEGDIDNQKAIQFGKAIVLLNSQSATKEIQLYIDSSGGSVDAGLDMYDMAKHSKAPIIGIVYRRANSIASIILQACAKRKALKHSEFIIHYTTSRPAIEISSDNVDELITDEVKDFLKQSIKQRSYIIEIYRSVCKISSSKIEEILAKRRPLDTKEALTLGLIDEIV